jgi:hypothetical protein
MTQDEIIEMARQAKAIPMHKDFNQLALIGTENIEAFAKLVVKKEREACATMSDWILKEGGGTWGDAIRARGQA